MNEAVIRSLCVVAGGLIGLIYFGGLWLTVRRGMTSKLAPLWFAGSMLARTAVALAGFYWVGDGRFDRYISCIVGFLVFRMAAVRLLGPSGKATEAMS